MVREGLSGCWLIFFWILRQKLISFYTDLVPLLKVCYNCTQDFFKFLWRCIWKNMEYQNQGWKGTPVFKITCLCPCCPKMPVPFLAGFQNRVPVPLLPENGRAHVPLARALSALIKTSSSECFLAQSWSGLYFSTFHNKYKHFWPIEYVNRGLTVWKTRSLQKIQRKSFSASLSSLQYNVSSVNEDTRLCSIRKQSSSFCLQQSNTPVIEEYLKKKKKKVCIWQWSSLNFVVRS